MDHFQHDSPDVIFFYQAQLLTAIKIYMSHRKTSQHKKKLFSEVLTFQVFMLCNVVGPDTVPAEIAT